MNKKILFQQCQQLALKLSKLTLQTEEQFRINLRAHWDQAKRQLKQTHTGRIIMPMLEQIFEKKALFKHCLVPQTPQNQINNVQTQQQVVTSSKHMTGSFTPISANQGKSSTIILTGANKNNPGQITPFNLKQGQKQPQTENQQHHGFGNLAATVQAPSMF